MSEIARILLLGLAIQAGALLAGAVLLFLREKTLWSLLQAFRRHFLTVVVLTHVAETLRLFPSMHWGLPHSVGHYVDFWSAALGLTLFPIGYFLDALTARRAEAWRRLGVAEQFRRP
jgi:cation transport ATPase